MELRAEDSLLIGAIQGKIGKDQYELQKKKKQRIVMGTGIW